MGIAATSMDPSGYGMEYETWLLGPSSVECEVDPSYEGRLGKLLDSSSCYHE